MGEVPAVTSLGERERVEVQSALGSAVFVRAPRLARLLRYMCEKYFAGEADEIKEYNIAVDVLERPESFDPNEDAIARVEIHRLRKKLREYYDAEGAGHPLRIVIPSGRYVPMFVPAETAPDHDAVTANHSEAPHFAPHSAGKDNRQPRLETPSAFAIHRDAASSWTRPWVLALLGVGLCGTAALWLTRTVHSGAPRSGIGSRTAATNAVAATIPPAASVVPPLAGVDPPGTIRILCGRRSPHTDRWGRLWSADEYFEGGNFWEQPHVYVARTYDPALYYGARTGNFNYQIPLNPGTYELHLFFAETTFGPPNAGGENSREFHVAVDRKGRILSEFDIISDAGGPAIADERVFKDISPGPDGLLRIRFMTVNFMSLVNAIEIEPARPHRLNPIRLVAQDRSCKDSHEHIWYPENYWMGGQPGVHSASIDGTEDPELYARERYGNFNYAIPVDEGEYAVTLHFAETYWGPENPGGGGDGSRVFDVFCNGLYLFHRLDIYKEVGADRALVKTFHHVRPNAQGKLLLSMVPVHNFASVNAIEVEDESRN